MARQIAAGILAVYQKTSAFLAATALLFICISLLCQIAARLASFKGGGWTMDMTQTAMVWLTGSGGGLLASTGLLLRLDLFSSAWIKNFLVRPLCLAVGLVVILAGARAGINNWGQTSPVLNIPMTVNYLALAWAGLGLAAFGIFPEHNALLRTEK